jgi:hypothetical protein
VQSPVWDGENISGRFFTLLSGSPPPPSLPARPITLPLPPCLLPVVTFLREQNITPVLMSSVASFKYAGGSPSSVFNNTELAVANCTAQLTPPFRCLALWLNHLADRYASPNPMATASLEPGLQPRRVFHIQV